MLMRVYMYSSNILLDENMRAKVSDFGLAKQFPKITEGKSFMSVNSVRGSLGYIADEFAMGEFGPKLDVYSIGVVRQ